MRVLLVDDDPLVLLALRQVLRTDPLLEVVGALDDGELVIAQARRLRPDVVLLDVRMKVVSAPQVIGPLRRALPGLGIVVMSSFLGEQAEEAVLLAGADAFLPKVAPVASFSQVIRRVAGVAPAPAPRAALSAREREVAAAVAAGRGNDEIAVALGLSSSTVRTYVSRLFDKVGVRTRVELATAVQAGVLLVEGVEEPR